MSARNEPSSAPPRSKRRRWLWIGGLTALALFLLVLLIPTLASTGPIRSYVLSKINANLKGKLEIKSWSLGWISGFRATGVSLQDKSGPIVTIGQIKTGLTLPEALRGNYALGNVVIEGLHFYVKVDQSGQSNLDRALGSSGEKTTENNRAGSTLPNIQANVKLENISGTIERPGNPTLMVNLQGEVKLADINQPITDDLAATIRNGNSPAGAISLKGKIAVIKQNRIVKPSEMMIAQELGLKDIDLSGLTPLLSPEEVSSLEGTANGSVQIDVSPGQNGRISGAIQIAGVSASGPDLHGDRFSTSQLNIDIPETTVNAAEFIQTSAPIQIKFDQGSFSLTMATPISALENFSQHIAPGGTGSLSADCHVDLAALARELPHTLDLRSGTSLSRGEMDFSANVKYAAEQTTVSQHLKISNIAGTTDGQSVALSPIALDSTSKVLPSQTPFPILRDISVKLTSDFASADFHGPSVAEFSGTAHADLAAAQQQLGQVFDFHGREITGLIDVNLTCHGDLTSQAAPIQITSQIQARNLVIKDKSRLIREDLAMLTAAGRILRDSTNSITGIDDLRLALQTGGAPGNSADLTAAGSVRLRPNESALDILQTLALEVDVPNIPRAMALLNGVELHGVQWTDGKAKAKILISNSHGLFDVDSSLTASDLAFICSSTAYRLEPIQFRAAGSQGRNDIDIRALEGSFGSAAKIELVEPIKITNPDGPLPWATQNASAPRESRSSVAQGEIRISGDLAKLEEWMNVWSGEAPRHQLAGQFVADQKFSTLGTRISTSGDAKLNGLRVIVDPQTTFDEKLIQFDDNVAFDAMSQTLNIRTCSISTQSSHALDASLSGMIENVATSRDFENVRLDLSYDLAKLVQMIEPMLSPSAQQTLNQYKIAGMQKHTISITGNLPAEQTFEQSIKRVSVTGSLGLDKLEGNGLTIAHFSPEFTLRDGVIKITHMQAATINGGAVDLSGVSYDLSDPAQRIQIPPNLQIVRGAQLNAPMLGEFGSKLSPLLSNPQQAAGVLDAKIIKCTGLSLAQFTHPTGSASATGNAEIIFSIQNMHLANDMAEAIFIFAPRTVLEHQLVGNIKDARIWIANGVVGSNVTVMIGKNTSMGFHGNVVLATQKLQNFVLDFPTPMLADVINNQQINQLLPTQIPIAIKGTTQHYTLDWQNSVNSVISDTLKKTGGGVFKGVKGAIGTLGSEIKKGTDGLKQSDQNNQSQDDHHDQGVKGFFKNLFGNHDNDSN
ncbi:MAG TPA: hypothetical protein VG722_04400 [Tepidisphaeraceae bacterium]|nr:hypothetical protein [Tepidisphaeraceae bacterium]